MPEDKPIKELVAKKSVESKSAFQLTNQATKEAANVMDKVIEKAEKGKTEV